MKDIFTPLALPHLQMFDRAQCEQIHLASLEILRRTGVRVHEDEARALWGTRGPWLPKTAWSNCRPRWWNGR